MKNKIIIVLLALVIVVGIIIICTSGFNLGSNYDASKRLNIQFKENFEISDIEEITKEVFENKEYEVSYMDTFKAGVTITVKDVTEEQIANLESKLKEKYETFADDNEEELDEAEEDSEEKNVIESDIIQIIDIPNVEVYDLVKIYIKPIIITTIVIMILLGIAFRKLGIIKALICPLCMILGINAVYISGVAILRIPVSEYIVSIGIFVYVASLIAVTLYTKSKKD